MTTAVETTEAAVNTAEASEAKPKAKREWKVNPTLTHRSLAAYVTEHSGVDVTPEQAQALLAFHGAWQKSPDRVKERAAEKQEREEAAEKAKAERKAKAEEAKAKKAQEDEAKKAKKAAKEAAEAGDDSDLDDDDDAPAESPKPRRKRRGAAPAAQEAEF